MKRLEEINQRLIEIRELMKEDGADLAALDAEVDTLLEERDRLNAEAEARRKEHEERMAKLANIAAGKAGEGVSIMPNIVENEERSYGIDSAEYRVAFLKNMRNQELTDVEMRAITTATSSAGYVVPTVTAKKIIDKVHEYAPLLDMIEVINVKGNVTIPAEGTTAAAAKHAEGATITASADTMSKVSLSAYEVTKLITISKSVETMSIDAFESWLVKKLARTIADKLTALIIDGTGTGEAKGINKDITWGSTNSVTVAKAAALTEANVLEVVGMLNGGYDAGAKWLMSKKTFFADFYPLMDKAKNVTVTYENGKYYVQGYEVVRDDRVTDHEAFLGNFERGYVGNLAEDVTIASQFVTRENSYDFLGAAMFDGRVQAIEAFVKIAKATS